MSDDRRARAVQDIIDAGRRLDALGWVPATAGNLSARLSDMHVAITRSGTHKGFLVPEDVIDVTLDGASVDPAQRPSAETLLHTQLYAADPSIGAVLHGHSVAATVLSRVVPEDVLELQDYELLKVFEGQSTHATTVRVPVFDNDQDIARLSSRIARHLSEMPPAYVIRGHGVYAWGPDMKTARARLEGLEFLIACEWELHK